MRIGTALAAIVAFSGCASAQDTNPRASAELRKADGQAVARATVEPNGQGLRLRIEATGLPAGAYGAHIHMTGRCDAPDFASAGGHWNPMSRQHGSENPQGPHMGDLPNLVVDANGTGSLTFDVPHGTLRGGDHGLLDTDGAAVIVHASPDDYRTDPSGNSGARIACGVLN
jgi:Cu-Zn family superoxide dismutase